MNDKINGKAIRRWYKEQMASKPKDVIGQRAVRTAFYRKELTKIVKSIFKIECSLDWDKDYIKESIINTGYIIISTTTAGVLPIRGALTGFNYIGNPTKAVMTSPILGDWENRIGIDCEILYIDRDFHRQYYRFNDLINITAEKLASADSAIEVNIMNSKVAYIVEAETKAQADTIKEMTNRISDGEPLVVYRKDSLTQNGLQLFYGNVKNTYIANDVHDTKQAIMYEFLTSLGVNNANTDKKERLISDEVNANNMQLNANTDHWKEIIEQQNKRIKKVFPDIIWNFELRYDALHQIMQTMQSSQEGGDENDSKE